MIRLFTYLAVMGIQLQGSLHQRLHQLRENQDGGYSTEAVIVTGLLTALALYAVGDVIYNKVSSGAASINFGF